MTFRGGLQSRDGAASRPRSSLAVVVAVQRGVSCSSDIIGSASAPVRDTDGVDEGGSE